LITRSRFIEKKLIGVAEKFQPFDGIPFFISR